VLEKTIYFIFMMVFIVLFVLAIILPRKTYKSEIRIVKIPPVVNDLELFIDNGDFYLMDKSGDFNHIESEIRSIELTDGTIFFFNKELPEKELKKITQKLIKKMSLRSENT